MRVIRRTYLRMVRVEIEDLREDIDLLVMEYDRLHENEQLSNYVFSENLTVIRRELLGVDSFFRLIDETDIDRFATLDDLIAHLTSTFRGMVRASGLPAVIESYVERKLLKVREYVLAQKSEDAVQ